MADPVALTGKLINTIRRRGFKGVISKTIEIFTHTSSGAFKRIDDISYQVWLNEYFRFTDEYKKDLEHRIKGFSIRPRISVIMPTYNSNIKWLKAAIDSVRDQIYTNWELCIADDASTNSDCIRFLKNISSSNPNIKINFNDTNQHISHTSNKALALVTGDYIALLDHDDLLSKDALFWVVDAINKNPNAALIYSDEDKINDKGHRSDPYFKCDWNYDLFLSQNMISHLGVYKTSVVKQIGGFRPGFEGSQDYDLAIRLIEEIDRNQIVHIPRILYQWRIHKHSTAKVVDKKPYALTAAKKTIEDHLKRQNIKATVSILPDINMYRVKYLLNNYLPSCSIIIPTKNNKPFLEKCIGSIIDRTSYKNYDIIVVDNDSDDNETLNYLSEIKGKDRIKVLDYREPFNFSAINNMAAKTSDSDYLCFLNDDTEVITSEWLEEMLSIAVQDGVGIVGSKLKYKNNTLQHGGVILGIGGVASHSHKGIGENTKGYFNRAGLIQGMSAVTGACLLINRELFTKLKGFNEIDLAVAYNDIDLCLRTKELGYRVVYTPFAELYHHESISRGEDTSSRNNIRFNKESDYMYSKWGSYIYNDPAYSPNLTVKSESFTLAWPPRIKYVGNRIAENE